MRQRLAWMLAITLTVTATSGAWGQQLTAPAPSGYVVPDAYAAGPEIQAPAGDARVNAYPVSAMMADPVDNMAKRVADLEKQLKDIKDKDAAAKKKAAGAPSVKVGGRIFVDQLMFDQNAASQPANVLGDFQNATYFRAIRLFAEGEAFDVVVYRLEVDFAGRADLTTSSSGDPAHTHSLSNLGQVQTKDAYVGVRELPVLGLLRVGHYKEPFSLEEITSNKYITFMERALPNVFSPARNIGVSAINTALNENATWSMGIFRDIATETPPFREDDEGYAAFTSRVTWLPWYDEATDGRGLIHTGLGFSYRDWNPNATFRVRQRPETGTGLRVVDTGGAAADFEGVENYQLFNPEAAFVYGPFSLQGELLGAWYNRNEANGDVFLYGYYAQASYFLTGEHRTYKRSIGAFDRVKPFGNFFRVRTADGICTGMGAWEVAYRYSWLDLNDRGAIDPVLGGVAADHTFGLNWYLNPYTRLMFNYIHSDVGVRNNGPDAWVNVFAMRAQIDF